MCVVLPCEAANNLAGNPRKILKKSTPTSESINYTKLNGDSQIPLTEGIPLHPYIFDGIHRPFIVSEFNMFCVLFLDASECGNHTHATDAAVKKI